MTPDGVHRILVADDDVDIRGLVVFKLEQAGFTVDAVGTGAEAWEAVKANTPDVAILDIMMPGLSGVDVLRKIRADESLSGLKVILLTARSRDTDVAAGFATGADEYVIKPFSPRELLQRVYALIGRI